MQKVLRKIKEIDSEEVGLVIYSTCDQENILTYNDKMTVPLASAAKVAIGFCIAKKVQEGLFSWEDSVEGIKFDPAEDSNEQYPHFQNRSAIPLREAVEVMIACHDSFVANRVVHFYGGWEKINLQMKSYFRTINVTEEPRDMNNKGELNDILKLMKLTLQEYNLNPYLWTPILNGLVRQQGDIDGIPSHFLNHMTGGLENVIVDIGILGDFNQKPFVYALGGNILPNRYNNQLADEKIIESMQLLYKEYLKQ